MKIKDVLGKSITVRIILKLNKKCCFLSKFCKELNTSIKPTIVHIKLLRDLKLIREINQKIKRIKMYELTYKGKKLKKELLKIY